MKLGRRGFLGGLLGLAVAPKVIEALPPVSPLNEALVSSWSLGDAGFAGATFKGVPIIPDITQRIVGTNQLWCFQNEKTPFMKRTPR
jgi:hypothetical protein